MDSVKDSMASTTAAIGSLGSVGGQVPVSDANVQKAAVPTGAALNVSNGLLLSRVETLITRVEAIGKSDALKAKGYIEKYWPIAAGILIAATRLLH